MTADEDSMPSADDNVVEGGEEAMTGSSKYPEYSDWLTREWEDEEWIRVYFKFQTAVNEQDEGRDIGDVIDLYRDEPASRDLIDSIMVALTGWKFSTIVTGMSEHGDVPDGFEEIDYRGLGEYEDEAEEDDAEGEADEGEGEKNDEPPDSSG